MKVIGISPLDKDATVSFLEDGKVVFACAEERLSRVKQQDGFPSRAMELGFARTGWKRDEVASVAYAFLDADQEERLMREGVPLDRGLNARFSTKASLQACRRSAKAYEPALEPPVPGLSRAREFAARKPAWKRAIYATSLRWAGADRRFHRRFYREWIASAVADHRRRNEQLEQGLREFELAGKLVRFQHHDTHAANAYYASGFDEALVVTLDGYGSGDCGGIYVASERGIRRLHRFRFPNSLGQYFESVTSALGFRAGRHEGKIVGLAAYGDRRILGPSLRQRFLVEDGDIHIAASLNPLYARSLSQRFAMRDVAAAYQAVLEDVTQQAVAYWVAKTGLEHVAVSGGVHANVKLNQRILQVEGVKSVFVYPNMGDGGCGTGAAMMASGHELCRRGPLRDVYYGPDFPDKEIERALADEGLRYDRVGNLPDRIAALLEQDRIVARFAGHMEYGPRALGNRSILYPAKDPRVNLWLNKQLGRTEFMPFAPAALASEAGRLFDEVEACEKAAEFMTITFDCSDFMVERCPAAVHVDRTARPQLVSERTNPGFHEIIRRYFERTGIPAIINTSFNMHEEPIVASPADAVRAFLQGNIDYLAIGPYLVAHPRLKQIQQERRGLGGHAGRTSASSEAAPAAVVSVV